MATRIRVSTYEELAPHLGELIWSSDPAGELDRRGLDLNEPIRVRLAEAARRDALGPEARGRLASLFGSQPPIRFSVAPSPVLARQAGDADGFDRAVTAWLKVASDDMARAVNEKVAEAVAPYRPALISLKSAVGRLEGGRVKVGLDCAARDACPLGVDLDFRLSLSFRAVHVEGELRFETEDVEVSLDHTGALLCTLLSVLLGPFGVMAYSIGLVVRAAIAHSFSKNAEDVAAPPGEAVAQAD